MDINELKKSKYFCMAPFVHIRNINGIPAPCCMVKNNIIDEHTKKNLNTAFTGAEWDQFRIDMLKNKFLDICTNCYEEEENGLKSLRKNLNEYHLSEDKIKNPKIRDIDLAMSNKCNFKCVTCGIDNSSAWYEEEQILKNIIQRPEFPFEHNFPILDSSKQIEDVDKKDIEIIRMLGGEPFLDERFLKLLNEVDLPNVKVYFVTNCSIFPKKWIKTLSKAKELVVMFSIDGVDEVGEFVRYGFKQKRFETNLRKWLDFLKDKNTTIYYHYVVHIMNVLNYEKSMNFLKNFRGEVWLSMVHSPKYLNLNILPDEIKQYISNKIQSKSIINHMMSGQYDKTQCDDFLKYIFFLENRMNVPKEISIIRDKLIYD